jgi:hypothetical protein
VRRASGSTNSVVTAATRSSFRMADAVAHMDYCRLFAPTTASIATTEEQAF